MRTETAPIEGRVVIAGAGPGDPDLITLRAAKLLGQADAVVYDRLVSPGLLELCGPDCRRIFAGRAPGNHTMSQGEINAFLIELARDGLLTVRLKGGDPFVFGRGGEEALALAAGVPFEIVPGVTFVTAHEDPDKAGSGVDYAHLAGSPGTLVSLMGARSIGRIARKLIENGMARGTPVVIIENASTDRQRSLRCTLDQAPSFAEREEVSPPAVVVIGAVAALAGELAWHHPEGGEAPHWRRPESPALLEFV